MIKMFKIKVLEQIKCSSMRFKIELITSRTQAEPQFI